MDRTAIGRNLARRMSDMGISGSELAEAIGVTDKTLQRWIFGERQITVYALKRCAEYLETTMDELAEGL